MPALFMIAVLFAIFGGWHLWKRMKRRALLDKPLSAEARATIAEQVPLTARLPADIRQTFEGKVNAFLEQVEFIGCDGLEVTDEIRLSIAAQACLLIAGSAAWYKNLATILVYPGAFKSMRRDHNGYVVTEQESIRLGESWQYGPVVLSWADSDRGARVAHDGRNVVFHEFAHQLDALSGHTDGVPVLAKGQSFAEWERAFVTAYKTHLHQLEAGRHTVIDPYGAESFEEFFAVSVELFFEKPMALAREEPEVYVQLAKLLQLDPRGWV